MWLNFKAIGHLQNTCTCTCISEILITQFLTSFVLFHLPFSFSISMILSYCLGYGGEMATPGSTSDDTESEGCNSPVSGGLH